MSDAQSKAFVTRTGNREKRKEKEILRREILETMLEVLMELIKSEDLSDQGKLNAVKMLDEVRNELGLDHAF